MPKIIENLREQIIEEARKQLFENGYSKTTIRSVAAACGIGTGTMYNYFSSKDILISSFMLEDWKKATSKMEALDTNDSLKFLEGINSILTDYISKYRFLFEDKEASKAYFSVFTERHNKLRRVIAEIILPICNVSGVDSSFLSTHIAESMLFWALDGISFNKQKEILKLLLKLG